MNAAQHFHPHTVGSAEEEQTMSRARGNCIIVAVLILFVHRSLGQAAEPKQLSRLRVSDNHRFLVTEDGKPFFYLADTAWELFHRLKREEVEKYFSDRAGKGFNVIQAVVLAELDGLTEPNAYGHLPLADKTDPTRPAIQDGPHNDYWDNVDEVIDLAVQKGLYVGLLPTWGRYVTSHWANGIVDGIFTPANAQQYGEFIGKRYKDRRNIIHKAPAIGKSTYIIMAPATNTERVGNRVQVKDFDLKACIDFCLKQGYFQSSDYLVTVQIGWEVRALQGIIRSDDLRITMGKNGEAAFHLPLDGE